MKNRFKNLFLAVIIGMVSYSPIFSKNSNQIIGKVAEKGGAPLSFATVVLLQSSDNRIVGGATSLEDGSFVISSDVKGKCSLKVSFIGYRDTLVPLVINGSAVNINLGTLHLESDATTLSAAVVTARVPVIEQKLDKIVMNVAEAVSTQGSNAMDIIRKAPGITVDPSGNILLNGNAVQVWIDGRPSNISGTDLENLLSGTDGGSIDKLEIIAHPSSKYDAAGAGGIINIKMKKNFMKGISGSYKAAYATSFYDKYYHTMDGTFMLNYKGDKTNTSVSYNPRYHTAFNTFNTLTAYKNGKEIWSNTYIDRKGYAHNARVTHDYYVDKKNIVGFTISGMWRNFNEESDPTTKSTFKSDGVLTETADTKMDSDDKFNSFTANLNYTHKFKEGRELTINGDYFYYDISRDAFQSNIYTTPQGTPGRESVIFKNNSNQYINIKSIKGDYEDIVINKIKMEAGFKYAHSSTNNDLIWRDSENDQWIYNPNNSTLFDYREQIGAAYISFAGQISPKLSIKAGIRAEYTNSRGDWKSADTLTKVDYIDFFPTLFVGYNPNKNLRFGASYTRRINRPDFYQLNPQRYYIDATSSAQGSPSLNPQYTHQLNLSLGIMQNFNVALIADLSTNTIVQSPGYDEISGDRLFTWANFGRQSIMGVNLSVTELPVTKWLNFNTNILFANVSTKLGEYKRSSAFTQANATTTIMLPKDYKVEISGYYQSGAPYGYFTIEPRYDLSAGVKKSMLGNRATLSIYMADIFNLQKSKVNLSDQIYENYKFLSTYRSQRLWITFNYRFGQGKSIKRRSMSNNEEASRVSTGN